MILSYGHEEKRTRSRGRRAAKAVAILLGTLIVIGACLALALHDWSGFTRTRSGSLRALIHIISAEASPHDILPVSAPESLRNVSREEAERINAAIPVSTSPNPSAAALYVPIGDGKSFLHALDCMTSAVYYEAASESDDGLRAVAQVVLNRVRHPAFPNTVCGVVFQGSERKTGCQFSFTCDGSLARQPSATGWARARRIASDALAGRVFAPVGWSTHYHTDWVAPYWAPTLTKTAIIGAHIFYRWADGWGQPHAFQQRYAGTEPDAIPSLLTGTDGLPVMLAAAETRLPPQERAILPLDGKLPAGAAPLADMSGAVPAHQPARPAAGTVGRWVIPVAGPARPEAPPAPAPAPAPATQAAPPAAAPAKQGQ